jgi:hypothetical protein
MLINLNTKQIKLLLTLNNIKLRNFYLLILFFVISNNFLFSKDILEKIVKLKFQEVIIRLDNGDVFSCELLDYSVENDSTIKIEVQTKIGKTTIFSNEILDIMHYQDYNRHSHRIFLLPTAEPIANNSFIGNWELLFFYLGVGFNDYISITAGRSFIPTVRYEDQISVINAKTTVFSQKWEDMPGNMSVAIGYNYTLINEKNKISNIYSALTFRTAKSVLTASVFTKLGNDDFYEVRLENNLTSFAYENGSFGIALGVDTRFSTTKDIHFIGEFWNSNITKPSNSGVLAGFRIGNTKLSADFGIAIFSSPVFLPFTSFSWTPF